MISDDRLASDSEKHAGNQSSTDELDDDLEGVDWGSFSDASSDCDDAHKDKRHKKNLPSMDSEDEDDAEEVEKFRMELATKSRYDISYYGRDRIGGLGKGNPNSEYVLGAAHFAVMEYNRKHVEQLALQKVLKVNTLMVAGRIFYITLEASKPDGCTGIYETEVLRLFGRPHILQEFRPKALPDH